MMLNTDHPCASLRFRGRVMLHIQRRAWLLSEIAEIWDVRRDYVHWLITLARNSQRRAA